MRIIGGIHRGRKLMPPAKMPFTRPTTDVAKEGLFNVLYHQLDFSSLKSLDLFGGTGSISFELASRGVQDCTIVEKDYKMAAFIRNTAETLQFENFHVIKMDVFKYLSICNEQFNFIFAGPPYALTTIDELPTIIFDKKILTKDGWFVLEHTPRNDYKYFPFYKSQRNYGTTIFTTFVENRE